eukprot:TRINITY_DN10522_c0_g1_i1.p1 TRINITY_DN10522_c0_g1~~TRINITY_DN10522_c0_g1_i1.p1  ORF type:complete len:713 (+),score=133.69 TRINITY_DN10522_c0_g1_i1:63-2201(+)
MAASSAGGGGPGFGTPYSSEREMSYKCSEPTGVEELLRHTHRKVMERLEKQEELLFALVSKGSVNVGKGSRVWCESPRSGGGPIGEAYHWGERYPSMRHSFMNFDLDRLPAEPPPSVAPSAVQVGRMDRCMERVVSPGLEQGPVPGFCPTLSRDTRDEGENTVNPTERKRRATPRAPSFARQLSALPAFQRRLKAFVNMAPFEIFFAVIIAMNGIFIGLEVDWQANAHTEESPPFFTAVSNICSGLFFIELVLRLTADRWNFFRIRVGCGWNYFDFILVTVSIFEAVLDIMEATASSDSVETPSNLSNLRFMRIIRITRLVRLLRIARIVRMVTALRILVHSILSTLKSVFWAMFLLVIIIYFFAIVFTQASNSTLIVIDGCRVADCTDSAPNLWRKFGTVPRSMFTLFLSISSGIDWSEAATPLAYVGDFWVGVLIVFVILCSMAVLNVVTGVFCQSAIVSAHRDRELVIQNLLEHKETHVTNIRDQFYKVFDSMDSNSTGEMSMKEFEQHINDERISSFFVLLDIDASDAWSLFKLLDDDGSGSIDVEEFVDGCLRLQGQARSIDLAKVRHENKFMMKRLAVQINRTDAMLRRFAEHTDTHLDTIQSQVVALTKTVLKLEAPKAVGGGPSCRDSGESSQAAAEIPPCLPIQGFLSRKLARSADVVLMEETTDVNSVLTCELAPVGPPCLEDNLAVCSLVNSRGVGCVAQL